MGSVFGKELRCLQKEGRGKRQMESEEGWVMDETKHARCVLPSTSFKQLSTPVYSRWFAKVKNSIGYLSQPLQIIGPLWEGNRKKGSRKEGCTLKSGAVVIWESGGDPPVTLLITLSSPMLSDEVHRLSLPLKGVRCVCVCVCVQ